MPLYQNQHNNYQPQNFGGHQDPNRHQFARPSTATDYNQHTSNNRLRPGPVKRNPRGNQPSANPADHQGYGGVVAQSQGGGQQVGGSGIASGQRSKLMAMTAFGSTERDAEDSASHKMTSSNQYNHK